MTTHKEICQRLFFCFWILLNLEDEISNDLILIRELLIKPTQSLLDPQDEDLNRDKMLKPKTCLCKLNKKDPLFKGTFM